MARGRLPTLLLPGLDGSGRLFAPLLAAGPGLLEPRVVALPADPSLGYDGYLEALRPALPRRGRWALLAESFSGPLAVRLAAERPPGLVALVLAATFLHRPLHPWLAPLAPVIGERLFALPLLPAAVRLLLAGPEAPAEVVGAVREAAAATPPAVLAKRAREALAADVRAALAATDVPLLLLVPTRDRLLREGVAAEVLAARPGAEVAPIEGPHTILQVRPGACLARIEPFLAAALAAAEGPAAAAGPGATGPAGR